MDDINDQLNKLSRQLDTLDDLSAKYQVRSRHADGTGQADDHQRPASRDQSVKRCLFTFAQVVAEEYNKLKDLKQVRTIRRFFSEITSLLADLCKEAK